MLTSSRSAKSSYLFVVPWPLDTLGGVTQVVENLMIQMQRHGDFLPLLMVNSWDDKCVRKQTIKGQVHYFLRIRSIVDNRRPIRNLLACSIFLPIELYLLWRFLKDHQVHVVNLHYCGLYALNIGILKALKLFRGKLILSFHGRYLFTSEDNKRISKRLWSLLLRSADRIVTCSEALKKEVAEIDRRSATKIVAINNGVDLAFIADERDPTYRLNKTLVGRKLILNVATFEHNKGQDILLRAFAGLAKLYKDVDLILIGRAGESLHALRSQVHDFGLEDRVRLYEGVPHNQIAAFYEMTTIFVLPSRYEPFGIVILEAGAFGIPVIASNVGGICEILTHDCTGRLCKSEDVESLIRELTYLLNHPEERERLGNNLKNHVSDNFSWTRAYRKYVDCVSG